MNRLGGILAKSLNISLKAQRTIYASSSNALYQQKGKSLDTSGTSAKSTPKKSKESLLKITLIAQNQAMSVTSLEEAQKLAKRRDLFLMQVAEMDSKTQRPVYKLVNSAEMLDSELEELNANKTELDKSKSSSKKSEKSLTIGSRISENDLASRLKNITKWLIKRHEVRILIQGNTNDMTSSDNILKSIEKCIKEPELIGKITQKRTKGSIIKFNIVPVATALPSNTLSSTAANIEEKSSVPNSAAA